jgi:hypothetical protein
MSPFWDTASNFTVKVEPDVNVWVRSLPLTEIPSDEDEDVTEPAVCSADAQLKAPAGMLAAVLGGGVTGVVPPELVPPELVPPELVPPEVLPPPAEEVPEALEVDVPSDEPPEHPVIIMAAAIAAIVLIRVVIGSAASRNKPLVRVGC